MTKSPLPRGRKKRRLAVLSVLLPILLGFVIWVIHSNTVPTLTEVTIPAEGLPSGFDGFRIVQISDLHDAEFGKDHAKTLNLIREAKPDVILLTGDLIDKHEGRTDVALTVSFVEQAVGIAPCYYVTGNHEGAIPAETYAELEEALLSWGSRSCTARPSPWRGAAIPLPWRALTLLPFVTGNPIPPTYPSYAGTAIPSCWLTIPSSSICTPRRGPTWSFRATSMAGSSACPS